ncbi:hypothetical protein [Thomasclavelia sp.]|uniref:hypothetical protein n=1 Tax=Thomasclavelia sp. TaxID=3025757 RepID=UPI0025EE660E|nr:hypothetical protein [Thomasclavelia sp.]
MKICCGVVLYNPIDHDINRIIRYSKSFTQVILYDNSPMELKNINLFSGTNIVYVNNKKK